MQVVDRIILMVRNNERYIFRVMKNYVIDEFVWLIEVTGQPSNHSVTCVSHFEDKLVHFHKGVFIFNFRVPLDEVFTNVQKKTIPPAICFPKQSVSHQFFLKKTIPPQFVFQNNRSPINSF